jgi:hypothetical protein
MVSLEIGGLPARAPGLVRTQEIDRQAGPQGLGFLLGVVQQPGLRREAVEVVPLRLQHTIERAASSSRLLVVTPSQKAAIPGMQDLHVELVGMAHCAVSIAMRPARRDVACRLVWM